MKSGDNFDTIGVIDVYKKGENPDAEYKCKNYDFNIKVANVPVATEEEVDK